MNAELPKVSTIITNYNYELYLKEAIDSALNQTYPNTETIVVDDGSTDHSRELIASYGNKIIPVYKENGGPASAFNAGFAVSQGEIVCPLDADDVWLPQKLEKVVEAFNTHSNTVVVYHKVQNIDKSGTLISPPWPPYKSIKGNISSRVIQIGGWWPFPPTSALGFSREFLSKVMNVPEQGEEYRVWVDAYLADLAPFFGEVVGIEPVLSYYRCHDSNQWNNPANISEDVQAIRVLHDHECRINRLNHKLQQLGINQSVNLANHWPYQVLKYQLGNRSSLISLSSLALRNPWEHRLVSKLKTVALLWIQRRKFSRI